MIFLIPVLSAMLVTAMITADATTDVLVRQLLTITDVTPVLIQETITVAHPLSGFYFFFAAAVITVLHIRVPVVAA